MNHLHIPVQPVKSSNIAALGYHPATKTLEVHFASGSKYRYAGVSQESFDKFMQSDSKGAYFARHVRDLHDATKL